MAHKTTRFASKEAAEQAKAELAKRGIKEVRLYKGHREYCLQYVDEAEAA